MESIYFACGLYVLYLYVYSLSFLGAVISLFIALEPRIWILLNVPELEVWPRTEDYIIWEQPLIQYRANDPGSWHPWTQRINDFLRGKFWFWVIKENNSSEIIWCKMMMYLI